MWQRCGRAENDAWQRSDAIAPVVEIRYRDDAFSVPDCRQNRVDEARQTARSRPVQAVAAHSNTVPAEITYREAVRRAGRQRDGKALIPCDARPRLEPNRGLGGGKFAQHQEAVAPRHKTAAAEGPRAGGRGDEAGAQ